MHTPAVTASYYSFDNHIFLPWDYLYQECRLLRKDHPNTFVAMCFRRDDCPSNKGCAEVITKRVFFWYDKLVPNAKALYSYFKVGESIGMMYFPKDMSEPRLILPVNRSGFKNLTQKAIVGSIVIPAEYFNIHSVYSTDQVIPASNLIK